MSSFMCHESVNGDDDIGIQPTDCFQPNNNNM